MPLKGNETSSQDLCHRRLGCWNTSHAHAFDRTLGKTGSEQKELEEKTKLITAYIRDDWIRKQMRTNEEQFTAYKTMSIFVGTYNVNGKKPTSTGIREWLNMNNKFETTQQQSSSHRNSWTTPNENTMPEIYVIGFQEIVDLNAANVIQESESEKRTASWSRMLGLFLNDIGKGTGVSYELVASKHLVGIAICVFVSNRHYKNVKDIQIVNCATGIFGVVGNKGGSSVRFRFYDSTLCFVCSHLAAHRGNVTGRNHDYATILSKTKFKDNPSEHGSDAMAYYMRSSAHETYHSGSSKHADDTNNSGHPQKGIFGILDHDIVIWLGDLNYRLVKAVSLEEVYEKLKNGDIHYLLKWDQLNRERHEGRCFEHFEEGQIKFEPSYKFIPGTSDFDNRKDKKMRVPAWCDRVLWYVRGGNDSRVGKADNSNGDVEKKRVLELLDYVRNDGVLISDHKPVTATFAVQVKKIQRDAQANVYRNIVRTLDRWENDAMPKVEVKNRDIQFKNLRYKVRVTEKIQLRNTGEVQATFRFVPKLEEVEFCKSWISLRPSFGMVLPGETVTFEVTACLDGRTLHAFNCGRETLDDILVLRFANGPDFFISVTGNMLPTCFGMPLSVLVSDSKPIRSSLNTKGEEIKPKPVSVPTELWRLIDGLVRLDARNVKNIFLEQGNLVECEAIREALDTGSDFDVNASPHSFASTLLEFIGNLATPVIPMMELLTKVKDEAITPELCTSMMEKLPPVNHNVFVYIVVFLKEILDNRAVNLVTPFALAEVFSRVFTYIRTYEPVEGDQSDGNGAFVPSSEVHLRLKNDKVEEVNTQEKVRKIMLIFLTKQSIS